MYRELPAVSSRAAIEADLNLFLDRHGVYGLHVPSIGGRWFDLQAGSEVHEAMTNPDPAAFEVLERLITAVHEAGASSTSGPSVSRAAGRGGVGDASREDGHRPRCRMGHLRCAAGAGYGAVATAAAARTSASANKPLQVVYLRVNL